MCVCLRERERERDMRVIEWRERFTPQKDEFVTTQNINTVPRQSGKISLSYTKGFR